MKNNLLKGPFKLVFMVLILIISLGSVSAAQWSVGPGKDYSTIQAAVNNPNTHNNDVINVYGGVYRENVKLNKKLTIRVVNGNQVFLKPTTTGFTLYKGAAGSTVTGFKLSNPSWATGFKVIANDCNILNNHISGGENGVMAFGNNTFIFGNVISRVFNNSIQIGNSTFINSKKNPKLLVVSSFNSRVNNNWIMGGITGISVLGDSSRLINNRIHNTTNNGIALWGTYPVIIGNNILNMVGKGSKNGILMGTMGLNTTTAFKLAGNTIYNIISVDNSTNGLSAFGMTMNANLNRLMIYGNKISSIYGATKATGVSFVGLALSGVLEGMDMNHNMITNIQSHHANASSTAVSFTALAFSDTNSALKTGDLHLSDNIVKKIISNGENSTSTGLSFVAVCSGNGFVLNNQVSKLRAQKSVIGISFSGVDYTRFKSDVKLGGNIVTDLMASTVSAGIQGVSLGTESIFTIRFHISIVIYPKP